MDTIIDFYKTRTNNKKIKTMNHTTITVLFWFLLFIALLSAVFVIVMTYKLSKLNEEIAERRNYNAIVDLKLSMDY